MMPPSETFERDVKLDALGVAFFAVLGAMLDEMAGTHPEGTEAIRRIRSTAIDMAASVSDHAARNIGALTAAAMRAEALHAIHSVFAGTCIGGDALGASGGDRRDEDRPGTG